MMINCSNNMDEGVGEAVTSMDAIDGTHLQSKESEYSLKPSSSNMLDSHEMVIPGENDDHDNENSPPLVLGLLGGRNLDRIGSAELASVSPCCMDGAGVTVEELTVREFNGENLAIVGPSDNREGLQTKQNRWQHLYQIAGGSGTWSTPGGGAFKDNDKDIVSSAWEDGGYAIFPENMGLKRANEKGTENMFSNKIRPISNSIPSPEGIRTKILSKSGFSEYFVKNTLKGKGVIYKGPVPGRSNADLRSQTHAMATGVSTDADAPLSSSVSAAIPHSDMMNASGPDDSCGEHSLRRWLKSGQNKVDKVESLHIFRQIVDLVDFSHSQGVPLQDLWPSCFKLLRSNQIMHLGSSVLKEKSDSNRDQVINASVDHLNERRQLEHGLLRVVSPEAKKQKIGEKMNYFRWGPQFPIRSGIKLAAANHTADSISGPQGSRREFNRENNLELPNKFQSICSRPNLSITSHTFMTSVYDPLEENWYRSPEELNGRCCTFASNIYCLGVLLFELLGSFDSERAHAVAMSDLRYRILPANFLSENPKEAGFCLWLLHPEPSSRPTTREILQSEILSGLQDLCGDELSSSIDQEQGDSEVLLHFLESLKDQKQKDASKLVEQIGFLGADIQEVDKRRTKNSLVLASLHDEFLNAKISEFLHGEHSGSEVKYKTISQSNNGLRLMRCINQLESAYFSMRSNIQVSDNFVTRGTDNELLKNREKWYSSRVVGEKPNTDGLGAFFDGLCKYARYSQFEVQGVIRNGDFNNSANVICSLSFDRDEDYFAAAGVSKKIRIYEFDALFNHSVDIHYPLIEMSNKSKLSCVCWNNYIRNYLASTDYDGVVKLWDAGTGQVVSHFIEHNKRAWSVDFSQVDPTKLASGSDDCSVKLWSINEKSSLCTIRNIANVCCVQFSPQSSNLLAFGSADYKTYCYDLRNVSIPWCILAGRDKAVSYVKFLDSETVVSASTDNTLKLWDLNKTSSNGLSTNACILSLRGHSNEKNFVGLSVSNGYIACGSETNEVFAYYRSLPMPITSHKFGSIDPVTGKETNDDNGQFVSSVCWRKKSDMVVAANSNGCIKLLQMV